VKIFFSDEQERPADASSLRGFAERVLEAEGYPDDTEAAVFLVSPTEMAAYNEKFMDRKGPTDVLAFPVEQLLPGEAPRPLAGDPPMAIGDIFLCPAEIERRAGEENVAYEDLLHLLLAHGVLHLLGYEHETGTEAQAMERREDELMALIGRTWA
jgi:probable rRNA maturation factor